MKNLIKYIFLPILLLIIFNFLEYGLIWNRWDQFVYPIILTIITLTIFFISRLRKLFFILSLLILLIMILLYLLSELNLANIVGSFGFTLLLIVISSYLPQIIKKGSIEEF